MSPKLQKIIVKIINNEELLNNIEENINEIKKDGKITVGDVPEFLAIVTQCYNNINNINISKKDVAEVLTTLINHIIDRYELIPDDDQEHFNKALNMGIQLVLFKPKVNSLLKKYLCVKN